MNHRRFLFFDDNNNFFEFSLMRLKLKKQTRMKRYFSPDEISDDKFGT